MVTLCSLDSPCSTFTDSSLVIGLFVVQLIVGAVFAFGGSCNHGPGLIPITRLRSCCVPRGCTKRRGQKQIGYIIVSRSPSQGLTLINGLYLTLNRGQERSDGSSDRTNHWR